MLAIKWNGGFASVEQAAFDIFGIADIFTHPPLVSLDQKIGICLLTDVLCLLL